MKVVVGGGRNFSKRAWAYQALDNLHALHGFTRLAQGGCRGADWIARDWAISRGIDCETYAARWMELGPHAGPVRNGWMLRSEQPDLVVVFPGGSGTADLVNQARELNIRVIEAKGSQ